MNVKSKKYNVKTDYIKTLGNSVSAVTAGAALTMLIKEGNVKIDNIANALYTFGAAFMVYLLAAYVVYKRTK